MGLVSAERISGRAAEDALQFGGKADYHQLAIRLKQGVGEGRRDADHFSFEGTSVISTVAAKLNRAATLGHTSW